MPRSARLHPPAVLHHTMICGIDGAMSGTEMARLLNMSQPCVLPIP
ncbi:MAG: hypothetical protein JRJ03_19985 [Deltaproteobacteria bacterium]|nr:hypothetical protein [Deltaproteobacteria bacterium]